MIKRTLLISAVTGFFVGAFWQPTWLWTIEAAQILSGVVTYPEGNPMSIMYDQLYAPWLVWPQAILLYMGMSTKHVAILFSGLQGALSFSAITAILLVVCRDPIVSVGIPLLLPSLDNRLFLFHKYPIYFPVDTNDAGMVGFYASLLVLGLFGLQKMSWAMFFLGLLPSIHGSIAVGMWIGAAGWYLMSDKGAKKYIIAHGRWFLWGVLFFAVTYAIHYFFLTNSQGAPTDTEKNLVMQFMSNWDGHRARYLGGFTTWQPLLDFFEAEILLLLTFCLTMTRYKKLLSSGTKSIISFTTVIGVAATLLVLIDELWPAVFPWQIKALMISRWLNIDSVIVPLVALGILTYQTAYGKYLAIVSLWFFVAHGQIFWRWVILAAFVYLEVQRWGILNHKRVTNKLIEVVPYILMCIFGFILIFKNVTSGYQLRTESHGIESKFMEKLSQGEELFIIANGSLWLPQERSNRGVLLDTILMDVLPYAPSAGSEIEEILQEVYNTSLYNPNSWDSFKKTKSHWEKLSLYEWQVIGRKYHVTDVVAPADWKLLLEKNLESGPLVLYHIPTNE